MLGWGVSGRACWSSFLGVVQIFIGGAPYGLVCSSGLVLLGSWGFRVFRWPGVRALFGWVFDLVFCFLVGLVVRSGYLGLGGWVGVLFFVDG